MFAAHGFLCRDMRVHERSISNRKQGVSMQRRWIQAVFSLSPGPEQALCQPGPDCWPEQLPLASDIQGSKCGACGGAAGHVRHAQTCQPGKDECESDLAAAEQLVASAWACAEAAASIPSVSPTATVAALQNASSDTKPELAARHACSATEAAVVQWMWQQPANQSWCAFSGYVFMLDCVRHCACLNSSHSEL